MYLPNEYRNYKRCLNGRLCNEPANKAQLIVLCSVNSISDPALETSQIVCGRIPWRSPSEHSQRQNDILILASLEDVTDEVRHTPEKGDFFAMIHGMELAEAGQRV